MCARQRCRADRRGRACGTAPSRRWFRIARGSAVGAASPSGPEPPAHLDHPSRARFSIPNDDRQQTANAIGDDFVVAAVVAIWSFASAALCERLGKRDDFAPGCQGREFTAHGGTLSSPPAIALWFGATPPPRLRLGKSAKDLRPACHAASAGQPRRAISAPLSRSTMPMRSCRCY